MYLGTSSTTLVALVALATSQSVALATLPADQAIKYLIHETPTDPASAVVFVAELHLSAQDSAGSDVGWQIDKIVIRQPIGTGSADRVWTESFPSVPTSDGLWWVTHTDPLKPKISEFALPPTLDSTADAADPAYADLDYQLAGVPYISPPPPGQPPYQNTVALDFVFWLVGATQPEEEGDDEVAELDGADLDP